MQPENILLTSPDDDADVKLCDFGFAKQTTLGKQSMSQKKGTPGYIAPEILKGEDYSMKADIWSLGCIFYVLLGGYQPFVGASGNSVQGDKEARRKLKAGMNTVLSVTRIRRSISREVLSDAQQEAQLAHVLEQKEKDHSSTDQDKSQGDGEDQDGSSGKGEGSDDLCTEPAVSSVSVDEGLTFETAETTSNA
ncbi:hypothetical protein SARC_09602 [Sphaeroforma arctica JP610]|uniref:Protein kinase domain-containing protein n=1 Tax=Sphaeroforma arctica JP610 TaxID=667725 RepID=A0A0L0FMG3_9EUKA|nr:hypothetical protein SARC_09602 [Sphaeroforma arctica JP610]KNC77952.1 hypothetical protein SARC_09602 [Sphaeroforma arctica JP610]|eukprot:XP_014151854.1 hypothetical protein SARC_09602 [Sphaeroforma arctica JP610]